jgi:prevent-host-death family protein
MAARTSPHNASTVISALAARSRLGQLLERVNRGRHCYIIAKRGIPQAILLGIKDYVRLAAPEPDILRIIGEESRKRRTDRLSPRRIDALIRQARRQKRSQDAPAPPRA